MSTQELIVKELGALDERALNEIYQIIKRYTQSQKRASPPGLMSKLKQVKIYAPPDFATNLDFYLSRKENVA